MSVDFEEILSRIYRNFEEQSKVLEPFVIIVNYFSIIINAPFNYIV